MCAAERTGWDVRCVSMACWSRKALTPHSPLPHSSFITAPEFDGNVTKLVTQRDFVDAHSADTSYPVAHDRWPVWMGACDFLACGIFRRAGWLSRRALQLE